MRVRLCRGAALSLALLILTAADASAAVPRPRPSSGFYTYDGTERLQGTQPTGLFPAGMHVWVLDGTPHVRRMTRAVAYAVGQLHRYGIDVDYRGVAADALAAKGSGHLGVYGSITVDEAKFQNGPRCRRVNGAPAGTIAEGVTYPGREEVGGVQQVDLSNVTLCPDVFTRSPDVLTSTVLHELGHAVGLGHFRGRYAGQEQVMNPTISSRLHYQQGDINGLRYLAAQTRRLVALSRVQGVVERWDVADGGLHVRGWAVSGRARETTDVRVTVDGRVRADALTTIARPGVAARFPGTWANPGYELSVQPLVVGRHRYCVLARSVLVNQPGTQLGCRVISHAAPSPGRQSTAAGASSPNRLLPALLVTGLFVLVAGGVAFVRRRKPTRHT